MAAFVHSSGKGKTNIIELYVANTSQTVNSGQTMWEGEISLFRYNRLVMLWKYDTSTKFFNCIEVGDLVEGSNYLEKDGGSTSAPAAAISAEVRDGKLVRIYCSGTKSISCAGNRKTNETTRIFLC